MNFEIQKYPLQEWPASPGPGAGASALPWAASGSDKPVPKQTLTSAFSKITKRTVILKAEQNSWKN